METIEVTFNIFVENKDEFRKQAAKYAGCTPEELTDDNIAEFIRENIKPARSNSSAFQVEGGDTDGWGADGIRSPDSLLNAED